MSVSASIQVQHSVVPELSSGRPPGRFSSDSICCVLRKDSGFACALLARGAIPQQVEQQRLLQLSAEASEAARSPRNTTKKRKAR